MLGHLSENNKIVYKNVIGAFAVKGVALLLSLFTTPAYIRFFNNDVVLGLWFTLLSVLSWILNFDLGIGNGLRNKLTVALTNKDMQKAKTYISSSYISIGGVSVIAIVLFGVFAYFIDWNAVFNVKESVVSKSNMRLSVIIVFVGIMLQFFLKIINSILYALQKSSFNNFISLITSILVFLFVNFVPGTSTDRDIVALAIVHSLAVILPLICASIVVFTTKLKTVRPSFSHYQKNAMKDILSLGGLFFYLQILYMIMISTNEYLITLFVNSESVVEYQIYFRFFSLGSTVFTLALTPIWSVVTKAISENNLKWIQVLYNKILFVAVLSSVGEFMIISVLQLAIKLFYGDNSIEVNYLYAICFAMLGCLMIFNAAFSCITNGLGQLKGQLIAFSVSSVIKIPLSYFLIRLFKSWIGVVVSTSMVLMIYCIIEPLLINKYFKITTAINYKEN